MGSQVSAKTNDKEQQLKKASKMSLIRSLLPIVGLVVIFLLFNVLTDFRMMGNISGIYPRYFIYRCMYSFTEEYSTCNYRRYCIWCSNRSFERLLLCIP